MTQQELSEKVKLRLGVLWGSRILMLMNMVAFNLSFAILGVTTMLKVGSYVIYSRIY